MGNRHSIPNDTQEYLPPYSLLIIQVLLDAFPARLACEINVCKKSSTILQYFSERCCDDAVLVSRRIISKMFANSSLLAAAPEKARQERKPLFESFD